MKTVLGLAIIPLLCLGATILTAFIIIVALRRGTKGINEQAEKLISEKNRTTNGNTRWARGDLQTEARAAKEPLPEVSCPACGAENPAGSTTCAFCQTKI